MKKLIIILVLAPLISFSQGNPGGKSKSNPKLAKVIIYREKNEELKKKGSPVRLNGDYLTTVWNNSGYSYELWPQSCLFTLDTDNPVETGFNTFAGETYYLRISVIKIGEDYKQVMEEVSESEAESYFTGNKVRNLGGYNPVTDSIRKVKTMLNWGGSDVFSIGVDLGGGIGFEYHDMVEFANGMTSQISGGGGLLFGIELSYRFTPSLAIQGELQTQNSSLIPNVSNAMVSFNRLALGLSPRYSFPFGKRLRFNAGPGIAMYKAISMTADLSDLSNGFKGEFEYKANTGFYVSTDLEFYFRSCSMGMGLKYSNVKYTLTSATVDGHTIPVDDPNLDYYRYFDGSGIHFFMLFRVHL
ncbi:MAG: hypothetical protein AB9842_00935 [Bacteroidales bacterium]